MRHPAADELADIRAEIARLRRREAALQAAILKAPDAAAPGALRPGWPIRRADGPAALH